MTSAITATTTSVKALTPVSKRSPSSAALQARQLTLAEALVAILDEVFATLSSAIADLGLSTFHSVLVLTGTNDLTAGLLSFLNPLLGSLGGLVLSLEVVVNQLLLAVTVLLDGLLTGLGLGLAGLTL